MDDAPELVSFLEPYPPEVRDLMLEGRRFLLESLSPVTELHYDATAAVCAAFAYGPTVKDIFVNLAAYSKHVTLVFNWGVRLDDPEGRLKGEGKQVRHLHLAGIQTLQDPYVLGLIQQASDNAPRPDPFIPARVIKVYQGPKRRP